LLERQCPVRPRGPSPSSLEIPSTITRSKFEKWIRQDLAHFRETIDRLLLTNKIAPREVEKVFLTDGTYFVPAGQHLFTERFGTKR